MQATIQVKYNNDPKPGKKMANVKDASGVTYFYYPDKMGFQPGETVTIDYEVQDWGGKPMNVIKAIVPNGYQGPQQAAPQASPVQYKHDGPTARAGSFPAPNGNGSNKDELIFVTGVVGRAMGSGKFDFNDIGTLTKAAKVAYHESFGDSEGP